MGISIGKLISNRFVHASGAYDPGSNPGEPVQPIITNIQWEKVLLRVNEGKYRSDEYLR